MIPHITDEIKEKIYRVGEKVDVVITEIGGTVGDIEGQPFIEAIRQFQWEVRSRAHAVYPCDADSLSQKLAGTQDQAHTAFGQTTAGHGHPSGHAGVPERLSHPADMRNKLSLFCNVPAKYIIENLDAESLYQVPLMLERERFADKVCEALLCGGAHAGFAAIGRNWSTASNTRSARLPSRWWASIFSCTMRTFPWWRRSSMAALPIARV